MGLEPGTPFEEIAVDRVFIGSCTNSRIGDLRAAAEVVEGRKVADSVRAMVVPGSQQVKAQAEEEGLDRIFREAGFDWREAGCSMCLGMNPDILQPGRALRLDLEPQLRGPPGPRRAHPPRVSADGRGGRHRGALRRHPGLGPVSAPTPGATWQQADLATSFLRAAGTSCRCSTSRKTSSGACCSAADGPSRASSTSAAATAR